MGQVLSVDQQNHALEVSRKWGFLFAPLMFLAGFYKLTLAGLLGMLLEPLTRKDFSIRGAILASIKLWGSIVLIILGNAAKFPLPKGAGWQIRLIHLVLVHLTCTAPIPVTRAIMSLSSAQAGPKKPLVAKVENINVAVRNGPSVPVRVYYPRLEAGDPTGDLPVVVYIHGGGFVLCNLSDYEGLCQLLCQTGKMIVVSVDYRRAPEDPFPWGLQDCALVAAWALGLNPGVAKFTEEGWYPSEREKEWAWDCAAACNLGIDSSKMAVAGDSAGGNLTASVCLTAVERKWKNVPRLQTLIYPCVIMAEPADHGYDLEKDFASRKCGWVLNERNTSFMSQQYCAEKSERSHHLISPLLAPDSLLQSMPPALLMLAEHDYLKDEGLLFHRRLAKLGVAVEVMMEEAAFHGFIGLTHGPLAMKQACCAVTKLAVATADKLYNS